METKRITLCGAFGIGHARDVVLPRVIRDIAESAGVELSVDLFTGRDHPQTRNAIGLGPKDANRRRAIREQPVLVCGHGAIEPLASCVVARCARYFKKPQTTTAVLFAAAVEGGTYPFLTKWVLQSALRPMRKLYVTDVFSAERLRRLVGKKRPIEVIGEAALSLVPGDTTPEPIRHLKRYIAVSLSPLWGNEHGWRGWISRRLVELADEFDAAIVFVPISTRREDDRLEARATAARMRQLSSQVEIVAIDEVLPPRQMAATFKRAILTVGMRLHSCVLSYAQQTPFVALLNHPKISGFAKTIDRQEWVFPNIPVEADDAHVYGFHFSQLPLEGTSLLQTAINAVEHPSFDQLNSLVARQRTVLREVLTDTTVNLPVE